jgi:hypothetical protein
MGPSRWSDEAEADLGWLQATETDPQDDPGRGGQLERAKGGPGRSWACARRWCGFGAEALRTSPHRL